MSRFGTAQIARSIDPAWKPDPATKQWLSFVERYYRNGDKDDSAALFGYAAAATLVEVLKPMRR